MEYIISRLSENVAKKIFGNKENAIFFLERANQFINSEEISNLNNKSTTDSIWKLVVKFWDYNIALPIIRDIFKNTKKYIQGTESLEAIQALFNEWKSLNLGEISWPCSQGDFDGFVQRINSLNETGLIKDEKVKIAAVKYRRLKEINTARNDYLETLIFNNNLNIIPTLNHSRGVDFFIDGISYDQKVAKSPTRQFMKDFGDNWKEFAKNNPQKVAEYLYKYQDEGRFGADPRLLIVYLDEDIPILDLKDKVSSIDFSKPLEITFSFKHKNLGEKTYKTTCFILLLSK